MWETFNARYIYSQTFCRKSAERKSKIFFIFSFLCLTWDLNPGFTSNKQTHCLLDYGNFTMIQITWIKFVTIAAIKLYKHFSKGLRNVSYLSYLLKNIFSNSSLKELSVVTKHLHFFIQVSVYSSCFPS